MGDVRKDIRALAKLLERQGWTVEIRDHVKWIPPDGVDPVFSGSTPSDHRAMRNIRAKLRRRGAKLP
jgi:hypothetical protein